ncbi:tail fiber protein [Cohnella sp. LGH]|uniref:pyocin knob domain-containing protein n=1 Tax=Cohnella sp. LGH TaxID=1619153 RepID=UPI001ADC3DA2|nr:pyocin knob domain-containing protein [Cohnella sp. LGH]QTH46052.1 tail fiber protein [Cohnella sp. LGH]
MPEMTQHIGLKKPLASETADISVINDNMDMIDSALGDLSAVPTATKDAAGAITELFEALENADIPDATLTMRGKVQLSSATNSTAEDRAATPKAVKDAMDAAAGASGSLSTHAAATNVHGATSAATASRLIIRDATGRAKISAPAASDDIARLDTVDNKFGAITTGGVLDWNDVTNIRPGTGYTLLSGAAANGPGAAVYYTPFNFEFGAKNGSSSITQFALPYDQGLIPADGMYMRTRYNGVWTPWTKYWNTNMMRINAGQLEFFDGGVWKSVSGGVSVASNTLRESFATERFVNGSQYLVVGKFLPKSPGEIVISGEIRGGGPGQSALLYVYTGRRQLSSNDMYQMSDITGLDWRTPVGTVINPPSGYFAISIANTTATTYGTFTKSIVVFEGVPVYFLFSGTQSYMKNLEIKYDLL